MAKGVRFTLMLQNREFFCAWCKHKGQTGENRLYDNWRKLIVCDQCASNAGYTGQDSVPKKEAQYKTADKQLIELINNLRKVVLDHDERIKQLEAKQ